MTNGIADMVGNSENMASVGFGSNDCSGTLITKTFVLTAAHCLTDRPPSFTIKTNSAFGSVAIESRTATLANCFVHPDAYPGLDTCAEVAAESGDGFPELDESHDLALLQLDSPFTVATPRPLGAPRHCSGIQVVDTIVRGWGTGGSARSAVFAGAST